MKLLNIWKYFSSWKTLFKTSPQEGRCLHAENPRRVPHGVPWSRRGPQPLRLRGHGPVILIFCWQWYFTCNMDLHSGFLLYDDSNFSVFNPQQCTPEFHQINCYGEFHIEKLLSGTPEKPQVDFFGWKGRVGSLSTIFVP